MLGAIYISNKMGPSLAKSILGSVAAKKKKKKKTDLPTNLIWQRSFSKSY